MDCFRYTPQKFLLLIDKKTKIMSHFPQICFALFILTHECLYMCELLFAWRESVYMCVKSIIEFWTQFSTRSSVSFLVYVHMGEQWMNNDK